MGNVILLERNALRGYWWFFFFSLVVFERIYEVGKRVGKERIQDMSFWEAISSSRLQLFFLAPEEHGEESLWPERLSMKIHPELFLPCFFLKESSGVATEFL